VALNNQLFWCGNRDTCNKKERKINEFKKCARCQWVRYCSRECQTAHWGLKHKAVCLQKLDEKALEEFFKGRRIIISSDEDENLQREDKPETKSN
jgi:sulfatase maturation enzyme AslB (radical SAM superfamily)